MNDTPRYVKNLKKESVVQSVINCLTDAMRNKELKPGDRIPPEPELAASMGVARSSVRDAQPAPGVAHMGLLRQIGGDAPGQGRIVAAAGHGILQKGHALRCPSLHHPPHLPCFFQHSKSAAGLQDRPAACGKIPP